MSIKTITITKFVCDGDAEAPCQHESSKTFAFPQTASLRLARREGWVIDGNVMCPFCAAGTGRESLPAVPAAEAPAQEEARPAPKAVMPAPVSQEAYAEPEPERICRVTQAATALFGPWHPLASRGRLRMQRG
ncbi:hypothetical protein [Arthrobacter caoxuetaonis]|uniref:Uncharacterized protein n=1 Tax=Arthrobacter caoxuetaonis TaxID=2886935 RepID=A0A9X1SE24_9MICC|nr:hypothetical protein [Arthrobacter caoxuetaonis]MCC3299442.1 hypothetical protein [Arthrobacter caoxuetaonis]USQ59066.1 hypothetical protein NF551_18340 [Arthrobacter caoxuetaonis]